MIREKNRRDTYKKMKSKEIFKMSKSKTKASSLLEPWKERESRR